MMTSQLIYQKDKHTYSNNVLLTGLITAQLQRQNKLNVSIRNKKRFAGEKKKELKKQKEN